MVLWGDKNRLLQVVNNLTSNALKFTPHGGTVRVIVRCIGEGEASLSRKASITSKQSKQNSLSKQNSGRNSRAQIKSYPSNVSEISETPPPSRIMATANEINALDRTLHAPPMQRTLSPPSGARDMIFEWEVIDTGPGMPLHTQEKVFEPFFQGDMALSKKFQGTGLGLSICAQLAKLMGGSMNLKSEEGKGSTFTLRIPLKHIGSRAGSTASSQGTGSVRYNSPRNSISDERRGDDGHRDVDTRSTRSLSTSSRIFEGRESPSSYVIPATGSPTSREAPGSSSSNRPPDGAFGAAPVVNPEQARSLKILVAEDNKTNQVVVTRLLKMEKITNVTIAEGSLYDALHDRFCAN